MQRAKIIFADHQIVGALASACVLTLVLAPKWSSSTFANDRQRARDIRADYARQRANTSQKGVIETTDRFRRVVALGSEHHVHSQQIGRIESGTHLPNFEETPHHEPGASHKN